MGGASAAAHVPVLYQQVLAGLRPSPGGRYIDGTIGLAGHAAGLLAASAPDGQLLGLDRLELAVHGDAQGLKRARRRVNAPGTPPVTTCPAPD